LPRRANYRGRPVLFPLGAVLLIATGAALAANPSRWLLFLGGVGLLGLLDDLAAGSPRGLRGHAHAVSRGEVSTGAIKALGTLALATNAVSGRGLEAPELVAGVGVLTLAAHLGNLLDTRPGRSEKALALTAAAACLASWSVAPLEPIAALLGPVALGAWLTLRERAMLGDSGASLIGGMIGILLVTTLSAGALWFSLGTLIVISLYGEFRSISSAIERIPLLHRLDSIGRVN
jgi:UDP-GlcNAc:undecaprenyl-phosphate/decaprenyl-phosphate GlcNAc-1-phosphate transferase